MLIYDLLDRWKVLVERRREWGSAGGFFWLVNQ